MAEYKVIVREPAGAKATAEITDFLWLSYLKKRNRAGLLRCGIPDGHDVLEVIGDRYQVEVWRRDADADLDWYQDFGGIYRTDMDRAVRQLTRNSLYVPGYLSMLHWRRVLWTAGTSNRSSFSATAAETIMKLLVRYNATSSATAAAGRESFNGQITWPGTVTIATDQGRGNTVDWNCAWDWLDETLFDLAIIGGGDFDLVRQADNTWEFEFYPDQLGDDLSETVIFSMDFDNVAEADYERRAGQAVTAVLIGGPGEGSSRTVSSVQSADWTQATHVEDFVNGSNFDTDAARQDAGRRRIEELAARETIRFKAQQTQALRYGRDYGLGDKVGRRLFDESEDVLIDEVAVGLNQQGDETIEVGFGVLT